MGAEHSVAINVRRADLDRMGLGHLDGLVVDLSEVEIGQSVEIQRRLGLTPAGMLLGLQGGRDACAIMAGIWLALVQAGMPASWETAASARTYPFGEGDLLVGKAAPTQQEVSTST